MKSIRFSMETYKSIEFDRFKTETGAHGRIANKKVDNK